MAAKVRKQRKPKANKALQGADEFAGADAQQEAKDKIAAANAAAEAAAEKKGSNGGPLMLDEDAWLRAVDQYTAEMLIMEDLNGQKSEVAGRISSIRKVAKKLNVDWDLVKRHYDDHKGIRKGAKGAMVSAERKYRWLLKVSKSPLNTEFDLWQYADAVDAAAGDAKPGMDAELSGQHAYSNNEPLTNNPFDPVADTERHNDWAHGWKQAQNAKVRAMGPTNGAAASEPAAT